MTLESIWWIWQSLYQRECPSNCDYFSPLRNIHFRICLSKTFIVLSFQGLSVRASSIILTLRESGQPRQMFLGLIIIVLLRIFFQGSPLSRINAWTLDLYAIFQVNCLMNPINIFKMLFVYLYVIFYDQGLLSGHSFSPKSLWQEGKGLKTNISLQ